MSDQRAVPAPSTDPAYEGLPCPTCGRIDGKRYGGEGRYHAYCADCWLEPGIVEAFEADVDRAEDSAC